MFEDIKETLAALRDQIKKLEGKSDGAQKIALGMVRSQLAGCARALELAGALFQEETNGKAAPVPPKKRFGESGRIRLTEEEHERLLARWGEKAVEKYIARIEGMVVGKGKYYPSHYYTIRNWMTDDKIPEVRRTVTNNQIMQQFMEGLR